MVQDLITAAKPKMDAAITYLQSELKTLRTGRAAASMLDGVMVSYYGTPTPLKALATVTSPEASQLMVQPFDANAIKDIRQGIIDADLGFNPSDDGRSLRIVIPALTAERREELVKKAGKMVEECKITLRTVRGDVWDHIQRLQKEGEISEDNRDWGRDEIDKLTAEYNKKADVVLKEKEADIRTV